MSVLDKVKPFIQMDYEKCFISRCWSQTPLRLACAFIIMGGFTIKALQTSELFKNQQNQICPYSKSSYITTDKCITFGASKALEALRASSLEAQRSDIYISLTWTHSALKNCLDILKRVANQNYYCVSLSPTASAPLSCSHSQLLYILH